MATLHCVHFLRLLLPWLLRLLRVQRSFCSACSQLLARVKLPLLGRTHCYIHPFYWHDEVVTHQNTCYCSYSRDSLLCQSGHQKLQWSGKWAINRVGYDSRHFRVPATLCTHPCDRAPTSPIWVNSVLTRFHIVEVCTHPCDIPPASSGPTRVTTTPPTPLS